MPYASIKELDIQTQPTCPKPLYIPRGASLINESHLIISALIQSNAVAKYDLRTKWSCKNIVSTELIFRHVHSITQQPLTS